LRFKQGEWGFSVQVSVFSVKVVHVSQGEGKMKYVVFVSLVVLASLQPLSIGQEPPKGDQVHIAVQKICPVSGQQLGAHGQPIKAKIGEEVVFLCCKACLSGKVSPQHWATIHANFAKAQGKCPVMNKPLPKNPKWTVVNGRIVYICCPPCSKKITADPKKYVAMVDQFYSTHLKARQSQGQ